MARPAHHATTRHIGAAYPFAASAASTTGVLVGRDLAGGLFTHDPFERYRRGELTDPNMVVFGQIGRGKSAFVKTYLWRHAVFGRRAWVVDPKGEYGALARAWGVTPLALRPGGTLRLNPLDSGGDLGLVGDDPNRRRGELLASLAAASLGRPLTPVERAALDVAVAEAGRKPVPTLPSVVDAMLDPTPAAARSLRTDRAGLAAEGRAVALELRRLVSGDLRGMFDGPTSPGIDLDGPLVVLDLSAVYQSGALGALMTCATAWLQGRLAAPEGTAAREGGGVLLVVDEAWAVLAHLGMARWLQGSWKLSRARGVAHLAVVHRVSDLEQAGGAGSEQAGLAAGLLADSQTRVVYGQAPGEVSRARELLGLTDTEAELVPHLRRGTALWKLGERSFLVSHLLGPAEVALVDTDGAMSAEHPARRRRRSPP